MIRELIVENFRGFRRFEMRDLGLVNLIVGANSSGKTSVGCANYAWRDD